MPIHGYPGNIITANPTTPSVSSASGVWTLEDQMQNQSAGNWPMYLTQISRSLRFNSADSAYLNRTPASAGNRKTWTYSIWAKRSKNDADQQFFAQYTDANNRSYFNFRSTNTILLFNRVSGVSDGRVETTQVFRDPSAWYHIVLAVDTTQATDSNRVKIYVNGSQVTAFTSTTYPSQNVDFMFNSTGVHRIGSYDGTTDYMDGYFTEINFIDGQALTPASFGFTDPSTGIWSPRKYTGPYGTNGFYLNFSDNSGTTATTLGKDLSGNGNNWTPNNFSVTAGAGNDSLVDTPTPYGTDTGAGGEVRGNYCTLNPLKLGSGCTLTNGNLTIAGTAAVSTQATTGVSTGKWYFEITLTTMASNNDMSVGVATTAVALGGVFSANAAGYGIYSYGGNTYIKKGNNNTYTDTNATIGVTGDVIGVAFDMDAGKVWWAKNNTWIDSGNPATGANAMFTGLSGTLAPFATPGGASTGSVSLDINFGQRPFAYTAPSGFKALCTQNLPTPTIGATSTTLAGNYYNAALYTGNNTTNVITGLGFSPDLVWIKSRSNAENNLLFDTNRGRGYGLYSNLTNAEAGPSPSDKDLVSFDSNGFTLGQIYNFNVNDSGKTFIGWAWRGSDSAAVSNTSGTITSTVSANTTAGFSIVTYTGNGSAGATIGHGLGVAPKMIFVKGRSQNYHWAVYHVAMTSAAYSMWLDATNGQTNTYNYWNSTAPGTSTFTVGTDAGSNGNGDTFVAYCFAPVAGYNAFGSYTGNGSTDGPFVYTGFRPAYVLIKGTDINSWFVWDVVRNTYNVANATLKTNSSDAEETSYSIDMLSNGFKIRTTDTRQNSNAVTYIYAAFAESPFKFSLAR